MSPKSICIHSLSKQFIDHLALELSLIENIRFIKKKINGKYEIIIKCSNYYHKFYTPIKPNIYGSYIYLYTNISMILSELILLSYENKIAQRIIRSQYFYFTPKEQSQILNITKSILDPEFPIEANKQMYLLRKEQILSCLLKNFRKRNYLEVDGFVNFQLEPYRLELEENISHCVDIFLLDKQYCDLITFILQNLLY